MFMDSKDEAPKHMIQIENGLATYVINRRGEKISPKFDMITVRNEDLCYNPIYGPALKTIDSPTITAAVVSSFRNGMTTRQLDALAAAVCVDNISTHLDYEKLAVRIYVSDLHKRTPLSLKTMINEIILAAPNYESVRLSEEFIAIVNRASDAIDSQLDFTRDFRLQFFGYQTIARSYLLRPASRNEESSLLDTQLMERPQHLYMRIALGIFVCQSDNKGHLAENDIFNRRLQKAFEFYNALSLQVVSNATPTMLNAATCTRQLSSCFQIATCDDLPSLFDTVKSAALISKWSGGISLWLHNIRADGAPIRKTGGKSSGLKRYVKILNEVQLYVDQGGNRPGAFAIYLSVDHDDIFTLLLMARIKGEEALKSLNAPDLKYALWVPDLFMEALENQLENEAIVAGGGVNNPTAGDWYLFSPDTAPGLHLVYGNEYKILYNQYVSEGRYRRLVKAGDIIAEAFKTWIQVGNPYVLFKDAINRKSNMSNVAPISSSNLCVSGDTFVLTDKGHLPIAGLCNQDVNVWNGSEWSKVTVRQTSYATQLIRIMLVNRVHLDCTPNHKFYVVGLDSKIVETPAGTEFCKKNGYIGLCPGDLLETPKSWPVVADNDLQSVAFRATEAIKELTTKEISIEYNRLSGCHSGLIMTGEPSLKLRRDLIALGCDVTKKMWGETRYDCMEISSSASAHLASLAAGGNGLPCEILPATSTGLIVYSKELLVGSRPTYCFNEPLRHKGVFNGILTGQCCEITIPSWGNQDASEFGKFHPDNATSGEFGVCNLAAQCLESFINDENTAIDFAKLSKAVSLETQVLNRVIDLNYYPSEECRRSNQRHRPIGIGIMGLADVLARLNLVYGSPEAKALARAISSVIYFSAVNESYQIAKVDGPYSTFHGSPISKGQLQPDLWVLTGDLEPTWELELEISTGGFLKPSDWAILRINCMKGVRNAYVTAYMPTATTSNMVGQNECFEPFTSNIYTRKTLAGEFMIVNRHLMNKLMELNLWNERMRREILSLGGSIQTIQNIPTDIRRLYRTVREVHPSLVIQMAKSMAPFICQSMSMNLFLDAPDLSKIIRFLMEGWKAGLKTGMYYCHMKPATGSQKTSIVSTGDSSKQFVCNDDICTSCAL